MGNLFFWRDWPRFERILFSATALVFAAAILWMWWSWYENPAPVFNFQNIQEAEIAEIPVDKFQKGIFEFNITGNNYTVTERLLGAPISINTTAPVLYLILFALFVSGMLAVVTTISRFYYLVCMGIFITMVVTMKLETLLLFGATDRTAAIVVLMLYVPASVAIVYFLPHLRFAWRLATFLAITVAVALMIRFLSGVPMPFVQLAANALPAGMAATLIFLVTVSHEILASFIFILTKGTRQNKTLNHFFIISLIYLLNLALTYSVRFGFITWNVVTIDLFLLLTISGVLGVWGLRQRQKQFEGIIDTEPYGVLAFLLMGAAAFGVIGYMLATANDAAISATRDVIIFSHIGFAIAFIIYVISNFIAMMARNMAVYKVLYSPNNMPFFTFRFAGLVASLAFLFYNTWQVPVNNAKGAIDVANADYFMATGNMDLARYYYEQGRNYAFNNHHASYALANFEGLSLDFWKERELYKAAVSVRPTEMAYLNLAQTYQSEDKTFEAILTLHDGLKEFPSSTPIENTLALLHARMNARDSARWYLERGLNSMEFRTLSANNLAALEVRGLIDRKDTLPAATTGAAMLELPADTALTIRQAVAISNTLGRLSGKVDSTTIKAVIALARRPVNSGFAEPLLFASALAWYSGGEVNKAFGLLEEVTIASNYKGKYNNILTLWCLEQNEPQRAGGYLDYAIQQRYQTAATTAAVTATEQAAAASFFPYRFTDAAIVAWDTLRPGIDSLTTSTLAARMKNVLNTPFSAVATLPDEDKFAYSLYRLSIADSAAFTQLLSLITDDEWKARTLLERSSMLYRADETSSAVRVFQQIQGLQMTKPTYDQMRVHEATLLSRTGNVEALSELLKGDINFGGRHKAYRIYFEAMIANAAADSAKATPMFNWLGTANSFFEDGVISAARYFVAHGTDKMKPYNILVRALQHHPSSIRIRKAYCLEARRIGLSSYADGEVETLKPMLPPVRFRQFMETYNSIATEE